MEKDKTVQADSKMSKTRKVYFARLFGRLVILLLCILAYIFKKPMFRVISDMHFFDGPSPLHVLWVLWITDMILQLIPVRAHISIGSQKLFLDRFKPIKEKFSAKSLKRYMVTTTRAAYRVMILWCALVAMIGILHATGRLGTEEVFLISVFFYVCDLICVLIWCPFRLILKNRCCTTCRIFNWDHLMMFSPLIFIRGFYTWTLLIMALAIWIIWELCVLLYPERFWENTNMALRCSECTDKLCTQYCRKLRDK